MEQDRIDKILLDLESGYDRMADKFSETRKFFWPDLAFISDYIESGDNILDYGCGNGRLLEILKDKKIDYTGVDVSQKLIDLARSGYPAYNFQKISGQAILPSKDNYFNKVISIAVFHHFPKKYAQKTAKELYRVTKPNGTIIITVWNLWQRRHWKYIFSFRILWKKIFQNEGLGFKDIYIPFKNNEGEVFYRYHHAYTKKDLGKIFQEAGFSVEKCFIASKKNIVVIAKKK